MAVNGPPVSLLQAAQEFGVEARLSTVRAAAGLTPQGGLLELAGKSAAQTVQIVSGYYYSDSTFVDYVGYIPSMSLGSLSPTSIFGYQIAEFYYTTSNPRGMRLTLSSDPPWSSILVQTNRGSCTMVKTAARVFRADGYGIIGDRDTLYSGPVTFKPQ